MNMARVNIAQKMVNIIYHICLHCLTISSLTFGAVLNLIHDQIKNASTECERLLNTIIKKELTTSLLKLFGCL